MQTTFIIKNITPDAMDSVKAMTPRDAHAHLRKWAYGDLKHCVSIKRGSGSFGDMIRWESVMKSDAEMTVKYEPRRGYTLATFTA